MSSFNSLIHASLFIIFHPEISLLCRRLQQCLSVK